MRERRVSVALTTLILVGGNTAGAALLYGLPKPENGVGNFTFQSMLTFMAGSVVPLFIGGVADALPFKTRFIIWAGLALGYFALLKHVTSSLSADAAQYS